MVASNRDAVVFSPRRFVFSGCLKALDSTHVLLDATNLGYFSALIAVRLAGRFAALEPEYDSPQYVTEDETRYDLSSGNATPLAAVSWDWNGGPIVSGLDFLALDSSGFAAWRATTRPTSQAITAMSCPSASLCVDGDIAGNILSSTHPTGGPIAWNIDAVSSKESMFGVSCPPISLCVAVAGPDVLSATDPSGGASAWTNTTPDPGSYFYGVSCPSVSLCVAGGGGASVNGGATILTSRNPTGGASSWSSAPVASGDGVVEAVSCPSVSLCVATTGVGDLFTSTAPTGGAKAWRSAPVDVPGCAPRLRPCNSEQLYARDDQGTRVLDTAPPGHGNSIGNVALDGDSLILTWTHDGVQQRRELR